MSNKVICDGYSMNKVISHPHQENMVLAEYHIAQNNDRSNFGDDVAYDYCTECFRALVSKWMADGFPTEETVKISRV